MIDLLVTSVTRTQRDRIVRWRREGYRIWRIAQDVRLPKTVVARVLAEEGLMLSAMCGQEYEHGRTRRSRGNIPTGEA